VTIHLVKGKYAGEAQPSSGATASDARASAFTSAGPGAEFGLRVAAGAQPYPFAAMGGAGGLEGGNPYVGMRDLVIINATPRATVFNEI
jgi:hypothetical protein